jgi:hypothetical protein
MEFFSPFPVVSSGMLLGDLPFVVPTRDEAWPSDAIILISPLNCRGAKIATWSVDLQLKI